MPLRTVVAMLAVWLLTAYSFPTVLTPPGEAPQPVYTFHDLRDPKLDKSKNESLMITNCAYGALRIGRRDFDPDPVVLLHAMLVERFGDRLAGRRLELQALTVHINNAAMLRNMMGQMYTGLIPDLLNDRKKVGCAAEDIRGGYMLGEVEAGLSPLIVAVHLTIDGAPHRGRSIAVADTPYPRGKKATEAQRAEWNSQLESAIAAALADLGDRIEVALSSPEGAVQGTDEASEVNAPSVPPALPSQSMPAQIQGPGPQTPVAEASASEGSTAAPTDGMTPPRTETAEPAEPEVIEPSAPVGAGGQTPLPAANPPSVDLPSVDPPSVDPSPLR